MLPFSFSFLFFASQLINLGYYFIKVCVIRWGSEERVCVCVQQGVDESGLELRDTDSFPGMAHKNNWIKIEEADGKKTEDRQKVR